MKVVLFCGGRGMRMREFSDTIPKPLVPIGSRPIIWHLMKYYAHYGHTEFILCLGYKAHAFKEYFLDYKEWISNDFVLEDGGRTLRLMNRDIEDWKITFVETGFSSSIGERLMAVRDHLGDDESFLANYSDGLTDMPLDTYLDWHRGHGKTASFMCTHPSQTFHVVRFGQSDDVTGLHAAQASDLWVNAGFFALENRIFDNMRPGEELVIEPFQRLIHKDELRAYRYPGFWAGMDTFKDRQELDDMVTEGDACWQVWEKHNGLRRSA